MKKNNHINAMEINISANNGGHVMTATAMNIGQFAELIKASMETRLGEGYNIKIEKITKNNGLILTGIIVKEAGMNIAPAIYVDQAYEEYLSGADFYKIVDGMLISYKSNRIPPFDAGFIMDYTTIKDQICFKLINTERNQNKLEKIPSIPLMDLSIVFFIILSQDGGSRASVLITNQMAKTWDVGVNDLYAIAKINSNRMLPAEVAPLSEILAGLLCGTEDAVPEEEALYVASNNLRIDGAAVMLYEGFLESFAKRIGSNFYIIPSSVHELLFLPDTLGMDEEYLRNTICEVNSNVVSPEDVLSGNLYYYNGTIKTVELV